MKTYVIKVHYTTGDSFQSHDDVDEVGMQWSNLEKAKLALQYIKEHYQAYRANNEGSWIRPNQFKIDSIKDKPWFHGKAGGRYWEHAILVEDDMGELHQISPFWCGYFERLHSAEIVVEADPEMKIEF